MLVKRTETALFAYAVPPLSELPENSPYVTTNFVMLGGCPYSTASLHQGETLEMKMNTRPRIAMISTFFKSPTSITRKGDANRDYKGSYPS